MNDAQALRLGADASHHDAKQECGGQRHKQPPFGGQAVETFRILAAQQPRRPFESEPKQHHDNASGDAGDSGQDAQLRQHFGTDHRPAQRPRQAQEAGAAIAAKTGEV